MGTNRNRTVPALDPAVRHLAFSVLKAQGYEVLVAGNGQDGLRMAHDHIGKVRELLDAPALAKGSAKASALSA
jgi:hypothetical protein